MAEVRNYLENRSNGYQYFNLPIDGCMFSACFEINAAFALKLV
jgi:hypothetical protein